MYRFFAFENMLIAFAYVGIALYIVPKFRLNLSMKARAAQVCGAIFFITCAMTHFDQAYHALATPEPWMTEPHMLLIHGLQPIGGFGFLFFAAKSLYIRIENAKEKVA